MFDYKYLLTPPAFQCDGLWYLRTDETQAVLLRHIGGHPVEAFEAGWLPVFVYTGLACMYLLALERHGARVTWFVALDGRRLGDKLSDLQPDQRILLREAVSARGLGTSLGLIADGMQFVEPVLLSEILSLVSETEHVGTLPDTANSQTSLAMLGAPHRLITQIELGVDDKALLLQEGWSIDEAGLCRGIGAISILRSGIVPRASRYLLTITLQPSSATPGSVELQQKQLVDITVNGRLIQRVQLDQQWQRDGADLAFWLPPELIGRQSLEIVFTHSREFSLVSLRLARGNLLDSEPLDPADLMLQFENIGDNCEFGLVQRHFNADPVGLLRFAGLQNPRRLIRLLDDGLFNFGKPGSLAANIIGGEYWIVDHNYGMAYHTFRYPHEISVEDVIRENEIKLDYLKRKFLEDLEDGEKILVYKRVVTDDLHEILALHAALNRLGSVNKLLWVTEAKDGHAPGDVDWVSDRLLKGYVGAISLSDAHDFDPEAWLLLCRNAFAAFEAATQD